MEKYFPICSCNMNRIWLELELFSFLFWRNENYNSQQNAEGICKEKYYYSYAVDLLRRCSEWNEQPETKLSEQPYRSAQRSVLGNVDVQLNEESVYVFLESWQVSEIEDRRSTPSQVSFRQASEGIILVFVVSYRLLAIWLYVVPFPYFHFYDFHFQLIVQKQVLRHHIYIRLPHFFNILVIVVVYTGDGSSKDQWNPHKSTQ